MTKVAKLVLDNDVCATVPSMDEMVDFCTPIIMRPYREIELELGEAQENL